MPWTSRSLPPDKPSSGWPSTKARQAFAALFRIGWRIKRQGGTQRILERTGWPDVLFAYHDKVLAKKTGLTREDL